MITVNIMRMLSDKDTLSSRIMAVMASYCWSLSILLSMRSNNTHTSTALSCLVGQYVLYLISFVRFWVWFLETIKICLSVCLSLSLSLSLSLCFSICYIYFPLTHLSFSLCSTHTETSKHIVFLSTNLYIYIYIYICLSISLPVYLSICLSR